MQGFLRYSWKMVIARTNPVDIAGYEPDVFGPEFTLFELQIPLLFLAKVCCVLPKNPPLFFCWLQS